MTKWKNTMSWRCVWKYLTIAFEDVNLEEYFKYLILYFLQKKKRYIDKINVLIL